MDPWPGGSSGLAALCSAPELGPAPELNGSSDNISSVKCQVGAALRQWNCLAELERTDQHEARRAPT